ncbi:MAG: hypothetical protein ABSA46_08555 [Thermodesulfovibrionales bacterium]|jgi:hypothetical protein
MILSYLVEPFNPCSRRTVNAKITTNHNMNSDGQPVIVQEDGEAVDLTTWAMCGYKVVEATPLEKEHLAQMGL